MDARQSSPSVARNRDAILSVLQRVLPVDAAVLEIASGTGEHAVHFARAMPGVRWQPSDPDAAARASIAAWVASEGLSNVAAPLDLDVHGAWPAGPFDAVIAINMIHISPWNATQALMDGAACMLRDGGVLITYGAYKRAGVHTAPSNEDFDAWLKERDPRFGVRDLEAVEAAATEQGLVLHELIEMPANNLALVFSRRPTA